MENSKRLFLLIISLFGFVGFCFNLGENDLHSSIPALEKVFQTEKLYIENTEIFLKFCIKIFTAMKSKFKLLKIDSLSNNQEELSLANKLEYIYRIKDIFTSNYLGFSKNISHLAENYNFPSEFDLKGVTRAINRLQDVYKYSAKDIANGTFLEIEYKSKRISAADCYHIGNTLFFIGMENEAEEWFDLAYELYDKDNENNFLKKPIQISVILDFVSYLKFRHGDYENVKQAIELLKIAIKADPTYIHIQNQLHRYKNSLKKLLQNEILDFSKEIEIYKRGCQGRFEKNPEAFKELYCTYKFGLHPFLKLAPIKVEIHNVDPYIAVFHDVLYKKEIEILKKLTSDQLFRALIWNPSKGASELSYLRTSKISWLDRSVHPVLSVIDQRIADMTDMNIDTAEMLQIMNYGIGGHYSVHHDCLDEPDESNDAKPYGFYEWGNRIATVLFYMSDVEQGGATVYPHANTAVKPRKGSAAFWFNMLPRGESDLKTRHAACPVVFGSKWVANKWIRYNGQMFNRQCSTNKDEYYHTFSYL